MSLILIVDDIPAVCEQYAYDLKRLGGHETLTATNGTRGLELVEHEPVDCLILDLEMPGIDGFEVLKRLAKRDNDVPVIVYTGTGNYERCVRAVKLGAYSFIDKSEPMERVVREIENALEQSRLASEVHNLKSRLGEDSPIIGESRAMRKLKSAIARVAPIPSAVLITGESGSGKELVARELHRLSKRARHVFLPINCAALPQNLVESELFGHEAGAFSGAGRMRKGAFEAATNGTLFLDEVRELTIAAQAKLLRVVEEQKITRVGGTRQIPVGVRVVAATNRDLERHVAEGHFRRDLYFRLSVHILPVPPLRDRLSDVPSLLEFFLEETCKLFGLRIKRISSGAIDLLKACQWRKNNVRELRNIVERMVIACDGEEITVEHVPAEIGGRSGADTVDGRTARPGGAGMRAIAATPSARGLADGPRTLRDLKVEAERAIVLAALDGNDWQITKTAADLGLADHSSLLRIMRRHKLKR